MSIKLTKGSVYKHDNGCSPSHEQLSVEKRKAGTYTAAIHESAIKSIVAVMATGSRIHVSMLREMMKPLHPPGTSLDAKLVFNFRLKIKRMLQKGIVDLAHHTISATEEEMLVATDDLDNQQSPEFLTEAFTQFKELLKEALMDRNDVHQLKTHLKSLAEADPAFDY